MKAIIREALAALGNKPLREFVCRFLKILLSNDRYISTVIAIISMGGPKWTSQYWIIYLYESKMMNDERATLRVDTTTL